MKRFNIVLSLALPERYASFQLMGDVIQAEDEQEANIKALPIIEEYIANNDLEKYGEVEFILNEFIPVATWILGSNNTFALKPDSQD